LIGQYIVVARRMRGNRTALYLLLKLLSEGTIGGNLFWSAPDTIWPYRLIFD